MLYQWHLYSSVRKFVIAGTYENGENWYMTNNNQLTVPYNQKFSRESNFHYFRERFENAKICLREKMYFKRSLEVGTSMIFCCIPCLILNPGHKSRNHLVY